MKKIAVLRCLKTSASCAGSGCLRAFNERTQAFGRYRGEEVQLGAVWTCNGCGDSLLENQEGLRKKIERMKKMGICALHLAKCTKKADDSGEKRRCPVIQAIADELAGAGIEIVDGTH